MTRERRVVPFIRRGAETNDVFLEDLRGEVRNSTRGQNASLTWKQLAADASVSVNTVSRFAYGETKRPTFRTVFRIAEVLGMHLTWDRRP